MKLLFSALTKFLMGLLLVGAMLFWPAGGFDYINGYTYTQLTDVEQEQNGIFTYDRKPKFDAEKLKSIFGKVPAWAIPAKK